MVDYFCLLVTLYKRGYILRIALKIKRADLPMDCVEHWAEQDSKIAIAAKIPNHIQGEIVFVEEIYGVFDLTI